MRQFVYGNLYASRFDMTGWHIYF